MEGQPVDSGAAAKLQRALADKGNRKRFKENPQAVLEGAGLERGEIPDGVVKALQKLSPAELDSLVQLHQTFLDNGMYVEAPDGGTVSFL